MASKERARAPRLTCEKENPKDFVLGKKEEEGPSRKTFNLSLTVLTHCKRSKKDVYQIYMVYRQESGYDDHKDDSNDNNNDDNHDNNGDNNDDHNDDNNDDHHDDHNDDDDHHNDGNNNDKQ